VVAELSFFYGFRVKQSQLPSLTEFVTLKTQMVLNFLLSGSIIYIFLYAGYPNFYSFYRRLDSPHRGGHPTLPPPPVRLWSQESTNPVESIRGSRFSGMLHDVCSNCLPTFWAACRSHTEESSSPRKHFAELYTCVLLSTIVRVLAERRFGLTVCT